ncbi:MAG: NTP transferase domain-containing protein, partial [Cytophagales bacterium]|nr:NTP transferase domain-containing protein [Cytophagales bacterium]
MKKYSIILAGGLGLRMKSVIPKQFLEIYGKPIIVQTIERFFQFDKSINLVVV